MNRTAGAILISAILAAATGSVTARPSYVGDPLQHDIMSDEIFMDAAWHFEVKEVKVTAHLITVTTTVTVFEFSPSTDQVFCQQRLVKPRRSLLLYFPEGSLEGLRIVAQGTGAVILESSAGVEFKVNCDSLLMIRSADDVVVRCRVLFKPIQTYSHGPRGPNHLLMDAFGAVGLFPIAGARQTRSRKPINEFTYSLSGEQMLWCAICPPREYPREESLNERIIWQYSSQSPELAVPSNEHIDEWQDKGTILLLQSEAMLWKSWHEAFEPRLPEDFGRVIDHSHEVGLRAIAYTSPFFFIKGTGGDRTYTGENLGLYLAAVADLLKRYPDLDGIYFDCVYPSSVKNTYIVCRATRELIGDERILGIHCTGNAPGGSEWVGLCYNPAADTWANFILRGEGRGFMSERWLRFFVSGYNISNAIGVVCNNIGYWAPTEEQVEMTLRANARLAFFPWIRDQFTREEWETNIYGVGYEPNYGSAKEIKQHHDYAMENWYWPRLNRKLPAWVEEVNRETSSVAELHASRQASPPHPLPGLTEEQMRSAGQAWLVFDVFDIVDPDHVGPIKLNGVEVGMMPQSGGAEWRPAMRVALPPEVISTLSTVNRLAIENPKGDGFKLRNIYIDLVLADGRRASSYLIPMVWCSHPAWMWTEGRCVAPSETLRIPIRMPVVRSANK